MKLEVSLPSNFHLYKKNVVFYLTKKYHWDKEVAKKWVGDQAGFMRELYYSKLSGAVSARFIHYKHKE